MALTRRWAARRHKYAVLEWAGQTQFRPAPAWQLPGELGRFAGPVMSPMDHLTDGTVTFARLFPPAQEAKPVVPIHVLSRRIESPWPATGLRPVAARDGQSLVDQFGLIAYPAYTESDRFVVHGSDLTAARMLGRSSVKALLPKDVGLVLTGNDLLLDFSSRPFDSIEFNRMLALAEQLVAHLPASSEQV